MEWRYVLHAVPIYPLYSYHRCQLFIPPQGQLITRDSQGQQKLDKYTQPLYAVIEALSTECFSWILSVYTAPLDRDGLVAVLFRKGKQEVVDYQCLIQRDPLFQEQTKYQPKWS